MAQHQQPKIRYVNLTNGAVYPDTFYDEYTTPENIRRQVSTEQDAQGEDIWRELMDKPRPGIELQHRSRGDDNFEPVARFDSLVGEDEYQEDTGYVDQFDAFLAPWASDTSGGPSNFHGNGGGDDNPRSREAEGEIEGAYAKALSMYKADLTPAEPDA